METSPVAHASSTSPRYSPSMMRWFSCMIAVNACSPEPPAYQAVDGKTLRDGDGRYYRLCGIDAPELDERGGVSAKWALAAFFLEGQAAQQIAWLAIYLAHSVPEESLVKLQRPLSDGVVGCASTYSLR